MCHLCNYSQLLEDNDLDPTDRRVLVLEVIGNNNSPLSAQEIFLTLRRTANINRVTVYRILYILVERGIVDRISSGGRSFVYGLAPSANHPAHPHFYCTTCGIMECLNPESLNLDLTPMRRTFAGVIENVEIRVDGVCKNCVKTNKGAGN